MMHAVKRYPVVFFVVGLVWSLCQPAWGQEATRELARQRFSEGVAHFEAARYKEALEAFQSAYEIKPHPTVRLNIAYCYEKLNRPAEAVQHYEDYLNEQKPLPKAERRKIRKQIRSLNASIGELVISIQPAVLNARVEIDGLESQGALVGQPLSLGAGRHEVVTQAEGYMPERREVEVIAKQQVLLEINLTPAAPNLEAGQTEGMQASTSSDDFRITPPVWIAGGISLALLLTGTITGMLALSEDSSFEDAVARSRDTTLSDAQREQAVEEGGSAADNAQSLAVATDVLLISGLIGAGVTTALFFLQDEFDNKENNETDDSVSPEGFETVQLRAAPWLSGKEAGLALNGKF